MLPPGARRLAREQARPSGPQGVPTVWFEQGVVADVTPGAASDGNPLVIVTYQGDDQAMAYPDSYTPTVGDTVLLGVTSQGGVVILAHIIGTP